MRAHQIARDFPLLRQPTSRGKRLAYLDSAATSQKPQAVIDALVHYYTHDNANIHRGVYELAERATDAFEEARAKVASFINAAEPAEIVWTRNTTEAINLVSFTWGLANLGRGDAIVCSQLEHHSNLVPWQLLAAKTGAELRFIGVDGDGLHMLDDLDAKLRNVKLVALSHVSNTLGTIAPLDSIVPRAHAAGALVLVDGAQSVPHFPVDVRALDVDFFAASGHKMCGPTGIGFLYAKRRLLETMPPFLTGGDMIREVGYETSSFNEIPWKFEAGTSNVAAAIALGAAVDYLASVGMDWVADHERRLTAYALRRLAAFEPRGLVIYGPPRTVDRSGVISFNFADIHAHDLASILDTEGVCVRAGHHCTMPLMEKMGWPATARASFYLYNTEEDVDQLAFALEKAATIFRL
ncbi:MAG: cysteine desulfurase [Candidatus Eremiobacteraeota bacterium]|nr:cysteine desulfurase [Candidatus Eremiobacteraeota bacterium]MBC5803818.1 cysteine desulfurase [Candidatus Eremiobacteraeota bacterium]MBC5822408.1 cysteine desulfurase [Candidatus Eremiobacteraeota bacterium]